MREKKLSSMGEKWPVMEMALPSCDIAYLGEVLKLYSY